MSALDTQPLVPPGKSRDAVRRLLTDRLTEARGAQRRCKAEDRQQFNEYEGAIDMLLSIWVPLVGEAFPK